ncbi:unnamed protein product [Bubo scandiacus]
MAMGHKRGQPGETPANSQKPPPGFRSPGRSDRLPCPPRRESCSKLERWRRLLLTPLLSLSLPRWARPSGATGEPATGRGGGNRGSPPSTSFPKAAPGCGRFYRRDAGQRRNPHVALITGVQQHPSPWTGMERSGQSEGEQPDQREQSPGAITHPTAPSPWRSKAGGAPWGTVDWTFLPVGATQPGEGCSWHGLAAAKLYFGWSHPSMARAAPAEPGEGSHLRSPKDARDPFASPGWGREQGRWQEVTLQIHLQPPALEGRCHAAFP